MAKARKGRGAAKRSATKRTVRTAKLKGRKVKSRRAAKPGRSKARKKGILAGAMQAVSEMGRLRRRLNRNSFEDQ